MKYNPIVSNNIKIIIKFQSIHRDFEWPYPTSNSMSKRLLKDLSRSLSLPDTSSAGIDPVLLVNR